MKTFLQCFAGLVVGALCGFDRLVFRGKLRQLYSPEGMHCYLDANHVRRKDFERQMQAVTRQVVGASLIGQAKQLQRFEYLSSTNIDKDKVARGFAAKHGIQEGLVCVLQCVEPCWSFELASRNGMLVVSGKERKCSHLYHYYIHPTYGWMYVRLQTWFPFEIQVYLNGREWLSRELTRQGIKHEKRQNKIVQVADWQQAQQLFDQQLQTNWRSELEKLRAQVHPLHPQHLGRLPLNYNWTIHQSEWASDVVFVSRNDLEKLNQRWLRQAMANFDSAAVLRFLGRSGRLPQNDLVVESDLRHTEEGLRIKHWVDSNSLKMYDFDTLLRIETTINNPKLFQSFRASESDPQGPKSWRVMRRSVADVYRRAEVSQAANERYLGALAALVQTTTIKELAEPLCQRVAEPGQQPKRKVRALNPLAGEDAALLQVIADPQWMVNGIRNRDIVAALYSSAAKDAAEKKRRSARVTRLIRILRGHGLLQKIAHRHRYQIRAEPRNKILAILAAQNANPETLTANAA
jgi:hypothetical protein